MASSFVLAFNTLMADPEGAAQAILSAPSTFDGTPAAAAEALRLIASLISEDDDDGAAEEKESAAEGAVSYAIEILNLMMRLPSLPRYRDCWKTLDLLVEADPTLGAKMKTVKEYINNLSKFVDDADNEEGWIGFVGEKTLEMLIRRGRRVKKETGAVVMWCEGRGLRPKVRVCACVCGMVCGIEKVVEGHPRTPCPSLSAHKLVKLIRRGVQCRSSVLCLFDGARAEAGDAESGVFT
jgi:hypothetical protein